MREKWFIFSFKILNSLIGCSKSKSDAIKTEMEFDEDTYPLTISADDTRLKQIMLNLISNAVKITKFGLVKIKCFKHPEKELLLISISDSETGIKQTNEKCFLMSFLLNQKFMKAILSAVDWGYQYVGPRLIR